MKNNKIQLAILMSTYLCMGSLNPAFAGTDDNGSSSIHKAALAVTASGASTYVAGTGLHYSSRAAAYSLPYRNMALIDRAALGANLMRSGSRVAAVGAVAAAVKVSVKDTKDSPESDLVSPDTLDRSLLNGGLGLGLSAHAAEVLKPALASQFRTLKTIGFTLAALGVGSRAIRAFDESAVATGPVKPPVAKPGASDAEAYRAAIVSSAGK